eukprot:11344-Hanusia_phi.AAC.2
MPLEGERTNGWSLETGEKQRQQEVGGHACNHRCWKTTSPLAILTMLSVNHTQLPQRFSLIVFSRASTFAPAITWQGSLTAGDIHCFVTSIFAPFFQK